jgi:hypothetical protein
MPAPDPPAQSLHFVIRSMRNLRPQRDGLPFQQDETQPAGVRFRLGTQFDLDQDRAMIERENNPAVVVSVAQRTAPERRTASVSSS